MWQFGTCSSYYPNGVLFCPFMVGWQGIKKRKFNLSVRKTCMKSFFLQAQALLTGLSPIPFPQHDPLIHKCLLCNLSFRHVGEYSWVVHVLAPFSPTPTSSDTISVLITLHLKSNGYFLLFLKDYEPNRDLKYFSNSFKMAFQHMLHLSTSGPFGMVFEHLWDYFHLEDSASGFFKLFQLCYHIT
jgi:hypothetical protein